MKIQLSELTEAQKNDLFNILSAVTGWGDLSLIRLLRGENKVYGDNFDVLEFIENESSKRSLIGFIISKVLNIDTTLY